MRRAFSALACVLAACGEPEPATPPALDPAESARSGPEAPDGHTRAGSDPSTAGGSAGLGSQQEGADTMGGGSAADPPDPVAEREAARAAFEASYPLYGVTFHFLAHVHGAPEAGAQVVGTMRRGSRFRATEQVEGTGCEGGWHGVPGGGFVCRGQGYLLGPEPRTFDPSPPPPVLEAPLPYPYARVVRDGVPQYWRVPTAAEERQAANAISTLRASRESTSEGPPDAGAGAPPETRTGMVDPVLAPDAGAPSGGPGGERLLPDFVRLSMERGFFVSLAEEVEDGGRTFHRTVRGGVLPDGVLAPVEASPEVGVALGGSWSLPLAFVVRDGIRSLRREPVSGAVGYDENLPRHRALVVRDAFEHRGRPYLVTDEGLLVSRRAVRVAEPVAVPSRVGEHETWIHVDLSEQTLVAYEGERPVFATVVSTGKRNYETPTGLYRIYAKHVSMTMDDLDASDGAYVIEDVPWVLIFDRNYALHGAFWHTGFGHVRSHGCVNLAPADARWLFEWSRPALPAAWHAVMAGPEQPGTWVYLTE